MTNGMSHGYMCPDYEQSSTHKRTMDFQQYDFWMGWKSDLWNVSVFRQQTVISRTPNLRSCLLCVSTVSYKWMLYCWVAYSRPLSAVDEVIQQACLPLCYYPYVMNLYKYFDFQRFKTYWETIFLSFWNCYTVWGVFCGVTNFLYVLN